MSWRSRCCSGDRLALGLDVVIDRFGGSIWALAVVVSKAVMVCSNLIIRDSRSRILDALPFVGDERVGTHPRWEPGTF